MINDTVACGIYLTTITRRFNKTYTGLPVFLTETRCYKFAKLKNST